MGAPQCFKESYDAGAACSRTGPWLLDVSLFVAAVGVNVVKVPFPVKFYFAMLSFRRQENRISMGASCSFQVSNEISVNGAVPTPSAVVQAPKATEEVPLTEREAPRITHPRRLIRE